MKRRTFYLGLLGIFAIPVATLELMPKTNKRLIIDPDAEQLVYQDGWIVRS